MVINIILNIIFDKCNLQTSNIKCVQIQLIDNKNFNFKNIIKLSFIF